MDLPQHKIRILAIGCSDDTLKRIVDFCSSGPYLKLISFIKEGRFAAELSKILEPDVVLIDASVDMNSVEVLKAVREAMSNAILIMMSVASDSDWLREHFVAGMSNVLTKPLDESEFENSIHAAFKRGKL